MSICAIPQSVSRALRRYSARHSELAQVEPEDLMQEAYVRMLVVAQRRDDKLSPALMVQIGKRAIVDAVRTMSRARLRVRPVLMRLSELAERGSARNEPLPADSEVLADPQADDPSDHAAREELVALLKPDAKPARSEYLRWKHRRQLETRFARLSGGAA